MLRGVEALQSDCVLQDKPIRTGTKLMVSRLPGPGPNARQVRQLAGGQGMTRPGRERHCCYVQSARLAYDMDQIGDAMEISVP